MRTNRGITTTSVVIYVVCLTIIVAVMGNFTGYFNKNLKDITVRQNADEQFSKFVAYMSKDVNSEKLIYVQTGVEEKDCIIFKFSDGIEHQYILQDKNIYFLNIENQNEKKIVLCEKVSTSQSSAFNYINKKIDINFNISDENFSTAFNVKV